MNKSFPVAFSDGIPVLFCSGCQVNPQIDAAVDLTLQGEIVNAAIDPELHPDLRSANAWMLDWFAKDDL